MVNVNSMNYEVFKEKITYQIKQAEAEGDIVITRKLGRLVVSLRTPIFNFSMQKISRRRIIFNLLRARG
jgi:hypothetical protein